MHSVLLFKKFLTLLALIDPFCMVPVYLGAVSNKSAAEKESFARVVGLAVTIALLVATFAGGPILQAFGISFGSMQIAGGLLALMLAIAMVIGKEEAVKQGGGPREIAPKIVPLAMPLLVGPAAISYTVANSHWSNFFDLLGLVIPPLAVGLVTWFTFGASARANRVVSATVLDLVEKIGGFLLAAMAIEMIGTGLKGMFPALTG